MNIDRRKFTVMSGGALLKAALPPYFHGKPVQIADICVYGGTASGVMAAVAASREGYRVVVIEPSRWLGGMTGGGIDTIDWGKKETVGGTTTTILKDGTTNPQYRQAFLELVKRHNISVIYEHRLRTVHRDGKRIRTIELDYAPPSRTGCPIPNPITANALAISAKMFIDCSYEGDLMAKAGVSYTFGRESRDQYAESFAGTRPTLAVYNIDPYVKPGERRSGLIPLLQDVQLGAPGSADKLTMAYCWRWKTTNKAERIAMGAPEGYDPGMFELFRRGFAAQVDMSAGRRMRKMNVYEPEKGSFYNNNSSRSLIAQSVAGCNADYPDGDWVARTRIWRFHQEFARGITRFLQNDPVVPAYWKTKAQTIGFEPGVFDETDGWPHQLYVRETRRMKSAYVITQKDLEGATHSGDSIGLASYGVDDWPYAMVATDNKVVLNGGEFSMLCINQLHQGIYEIPYRAITPESNECTNLLVPICVSASHIAMTSIRMEPVLMLLGESAGVAAALALKNRISVQEVEYSQLRSKLLAFNQILDRTTGGN